MDDKITIIEGPTPEFETIDDGWALGLNEGPSFYDMALTRLRTFNGAALVERCHRAWNTSGQMSLHFRNDLGMEEQIPIVAARSIESEEGQLLYLWVRLKPEETEYELDVDDDEEDLDF